MMHELVKTADVFVENYRPGALTKLGLGYPELSKLNPRLVYCSVSAYGHTGPDSAKAGFGLIAEAKSGAMAQLGNPGETPPLLRIPIADMYTGVHGVAAICAALIGRATSGKGQHIDLALYDCMVSIHDYAVQRYTFSGGTDLPRQTGAGQPDSPIYGVFSGSDGYLVIAAQVDRLLAAACPADRWLRACGRRALRDPPDGRELCRRDPHRRYVDQSAYGQGGSCGARCRRSAMLGGRRSSGAGRSEFQADMIIEQEHPVLGKVKPPNLPFRLSDCDTTPRMPAPLLAAQSYHRRVSRLFRG